MVRGQSRQWEHDAGLYAQVASTALRGIYTFVSVHVDRDGRVDWIETGRPVGDDQSVVTTGFMPADVLALASAQTGQDVWLVTADEAGRSPASATARARGRACASPFPAARTKPPGACSPAGSRPEPRPISPASCDPVQDRAADGRAGGQRRFGRVAAGGPQPGAVDADAADAGDLGRVGAGGRDRPAPRIPADPGPDRRPDRPGRQRHGRPDPVPGADRRAGTARRRHRDAALRGGGAGAGCAGSASMRPRWSIAPITTA